MKYYNPLHSDFVDFTENRVITATGDVWLGYKISGYPWIRLSPDNTDRTQLIGGLLFSDVVRTGLISNFYFTSIRTTSSPESIIECMKLPPRSQNPEVWEEADAITEAFTSGEMYEDNREYYFFVQLLHMRSMTSKFLDALMKTVTVLSEDYISECHEIILASFPPYLTVTPTTGGDVHVIATRRTTLAYPPPVTGATPIEVGCNSFPDIAVSKFPTRKYLLSDFLDTAKSFNVNVNKSFEHYVKTIMRTPDNIVQITAVDDQNTDNFTGNTSYIAHLLITGMPKNLDDPSQFLPYLDTLPLRGIDYTIVGVPDDTLHDPQRFSKLDKKNEAEKNANTSDMFTSRGYDKLSEDIEHLFEIIQKGVNFAGVRFTIIVSIGTDNLAATTRMAREVRTHFTSLGFTCTTYAGSGYDLWLETLPGAVKNPIVWENLLPNSCEQIGNLLPATVPSTGAREGMILGQIQGSSLCTLVFYDPIGVTRKGASGALIQIGELGTGKSLTEKRILLFMHLLRCYVPVLDVDGEYASIAYGIDQPVIEFSQTEPVHSLCPLVNFPDNKQYAAQLWLDTVYPMLKLREELQGPAYKLFASIIHPDNRQHRIPGYQRPINCTRDIVEVLSTNNDPLARECYDALAKFITAPGYSLLFNPIDSVTRDCLPMNSVRDLTGFVVFWLGDITLPATDETATDNDRFVSVLLELVWKIVLWRFVQNYDPGAFSVGEAHRLEESPFAKKAIAEATNTWRKRNKNFYASTPLPQHYGVEYGAVVQTLGYRQRIPENAETQLRRQSVAVTEENILLVQNLSPTNPRTNRVYPGRYGEAIYTDGFGNILVIKTMLPFVHWQRILLDTNPDTRLSPAQVREIKLKQLIQSQEEGVLL